MSRRPSNKSSPKGADSISGNQSISQSGIAGRTALSDITELEIEGYGKDEGEALESFADVFSATWQAYAEEDGRLSTRFLKYGHVFKRSECGAAPRAAAASHAAWPEADRGAAAAHGAAPRRRNTLANF